MTRIIKQLWRDDEGALIALEYLVIVTIMVLGLVVGLKAVQGSLATEFEELASAISSFSQSFEIGGHKLGWWDDHRTVAGRRDANGNHNVNTHSTLAWTQGSRYDDKPASFKVETTSSRDSQDLSYPN